MSESSCCKRIKQLEYFRAIVDAGTISGAARNLHMTQPPLSYQIKMLEEELGVKLFVRGAKNTTLTEAGKALYIRAGSLLTMADITKREVIKANEVATIHIGLAPSTVSMMAKQFKASMRPLADKCFVYKIDSDELITEVLLAWNKEKVTDEIKEFLEFLFNQFD